MAAGIYKLTFSSGKFYIGKSNDLDRRWNEHCTKFQKGTAAKNMQAEFNRCGYPEREIINYCHEDHIDILEALYIEGGWGPSILNTSRPTTISTRELEFLNLNIKCLEYGTAVHCKVMWDQSRELEQMRSAAENRQKQHSLEIARLKKGTVIPELEEKVSSLAYSLELSKQEVKKLKSRNWIQRLFNS